MTRLDEEGPGALVRVPQPVNKFPDFVAYLVCRLKVLCPTMGKARIANVLCRAGLHLGTTTVRRMLRDANQPEPTKRGTQPGTAPACESGQLIARKISRHFEYFQQNRSSA